MPLRILQKSEDPRDCAQGAAMIGNRMSKLVLINGRTVYTPTFVGVYWHMSNTPTADIDCIEVIRGPEHQFT